jgi:hypothetical protein
MMPARVATSTDLTAPDPPISTGLVVLLTRHIVQPPVTAHAESCAG